MMNADSADRSPWRFFVGNAMPREVRFAIEPGSVATLEGPVPYQTGDAIVTGTADDPYPIARTEFDNRYRPLDDQAPGVAGLYVKRAAELVRAHQPDADFTVTLASGGQLAGRPGDWLLRGADGRERIVAEHLFASYYAPASVPVIIGIRADAIARRSEIEALTQGMARSLPYTTFTLQTVADEADDDRFASDGLWCVIVDERSRELVRTRGQSTPPIRKVPLVAAQDFLEPRRDGRDGLELERLVRESRVASRALDDATPWVDRRLQVRVAARLLRELFFEHADIAGWMSRMFPTRGAARHPSASAAGIDTEPGTVRVPPTKILAEQWGELDAYNESLHRHLVHPASCHYIETIEAWLGQPEPPWSRHVLVWHAGAIADARASHYQTRWQRFVLARTADIVGSTWSPWRCFVPVHLVGWGLTALLCFALFSEVPDTCVAFGGAASCHASATFLITGYTALFAITVLYLCYAKLLRLETRHQDRRLLAEYLRVQYVWEAMGLACHVADAIDIVVPGPADWVNAAMRSLRRSLGRVVRQSHDPASAEDWAIAKFLREQLHYHDDTLERRRRDALERFHPVVNIGWAVGLLGLAGMALMYWFAQLSEPALAVGHLVFTLMIVMGPATAAALGKVAGTYGWEEELQHGAVVASNLSQGDLDVKNGANRTQVVLATGKYFAREQVAWHALHRGKPIEVPW